MKKSPKVHYKDNLTSLKKKERNIMKKIISISSMKLYYITAILLLIVGCARLSIREINFYDEKTALENQILGTYKEIESDPYFSTSVRSINVKDDNRNSKMNSSETVFDSKFIQAIKQRVIIADKLDRYRNEGLIRENDDGYVIFFDELRSSLKKTASSEILEVVKTENAARKSIIKEITTRNISTKNIDEKIVMQTMRKIFLEAAPSGTWIQISGKWHQK